LFDNHLPLNIHPIGSLLRTFLFSALQLPSSCSAENRIWAAAAAHPLITRTIHSHPPPPPHTNTHTHTVTRTVTHTHTHTHAHTHNFISLAMVELVKRKMLFKISIRFCSQLSFIALCLAWLSFTNNLFFIFPLLKILTFSTSQIVIIQILLPLTFVCKG